MSFKFKIFFFITIIFSTNFSFLSKNEKKVDSNVHPKNIILIIGDGMGLGQASAGIFNSPKLFSLIKFPVVGFQTTHCFNDIITDSAAGATAMACGVKTYRSAVGINSDTVRVESILEEAEKRDLATGLIATSSIVHATPAAFYAHQPLRNFYEDIALDLTKVEVDFICGGGESYFYHRRNDGRDLIKEMKSIGYDIYDIEKKSLSKLKVNPAKNFCYFTAPKKPASVLEGRNYLPIASKKAMTYLTQHSKNGFFLMIEGSQIDWSGHANEDYSLLKELEDFNKAVEEVLKFASINQETLVIVTADHETGGLAINPKSKKKKLRLGWTSNNHTATMVPVYAIGPKSELFRGIFDNTDLYHKMRAAFGWEEKEKSGNTLNSK